MQDPKWGGMNCSKRCRRTTRACPIRHSKRCADSCPSFVPKWTGTRFDLILWKDKKKKRTCFFRCNRTASGRKWSSNSSFEQPRQIYRCLVHNSKFSPSFSLTVPLQLVCSITRSCSFNSFDPHLYLFLLRLLIYLFTFRGYLKTSSHAK